MKNTLRTTSTHWALPLAGLLAFPGTVAQDSADELHSGEQLVQACQALVSEGDSRRGRLCEGYLLGFLQGNPAVVFSEQLPSEYIQRALRTRAPTHETTRQIKSAEYCLAGRDSVESVEADIADLSAGEVAPLTPADVILLVLGRGYRC